MSTIPQETTLWEVLHDGSIVDVQAPDPTTLLLRVDIPYLAERLTPKADAVRIALHGVVRADHLSSENAPPIALVDLFAQRRGERDRRLEILDADAKGAELVVYGEGYLHLQYDHAVLTHDDGTPLPLDTLLAVATAYWADFGRGT